MSKISLRNAEIIDDLITKLKLNRRPLGQSDDNVDILKTSIRILVCMKLHHMIMKKREVKHIIKLKWMFLRSLKKFYRR